MKNKNRFHDGVIIVSVAILMIVTNCKKDNLSQEIVHQFGSITDIEGNAYRTIKIGNQVWMADNLKTAHYRNGDIIETTTKSAMSYNVDESITGFQWIYSDIEIKDDNLKIFGRLYNWNAISDKRNICPDGYHIPSKVEWNVLINHLCGEKEAGSKLQTNVGNYWAFKNVDGTNSSGFSAIPGGHRMPVGTFEYKGYDCYFWSSTIDDNVKVDSPAFIFHLVYPKSLIYPNLSVSSEMGDKRYGFSVRCVKD
jgi:uncharacterized protein (TIGR02145 family)